MIGKENEESPPEKLPSKAIDVSFGNLFNKSSSKGPSLIDVKISGRIYRKSRYKRKYS